MNTLFSELQKRGWMRYDSVLAQDRGGWVAVEEEDIKKILKRLVSDAHTKMKTPPPNGFGIIMYHASTDKSIFAYIGDYIRREFLKQATDKTKLPVKVKLNE